jgi:hypothetical protein
MEEKDYRLVLLGKRQVGLVGKAGGFSGAKRDLRGVEGPQGEARISLEGDAGGKGGKKEVQVDFTGNTVRDLLDTLFLKIGAKENPLFLNDQGEISPRLKVNVNRKWISDSNQLSKKLRENDVVELALAPAA